MSIKVKKQQKQTMEEKLNTLRAGVLGSNDGILTVVGVLVQVEKAAVAKEEQLLKTDYEGELAAVKDYYVNKGVTPETSIKIAKDLLNKKPLETVVRIKYDIELGHYLNPWDAAFSSLFSAAAGGLIPLMAMTFAPEAYKWYAVILAVAFTSALTGYISSKLGNGLVKVAVIRNIIIGLITITIHYGVGKLF